jgi:hypothetical protein
MSIVLEIVNPGNIFGKIFWILVLIFVAYTVVQNPSHSSNSGESYVVEQVSLTSSEMRIIELYSGHAWQNHGEEVNTAFRCLEDNGTWKSFITRGFKNDKGEDIPTNVWICKDKNNDFYAIVTTTFQKIGRDQVARLVTAYKIAKDVFPLIDDFTTYISQKWGAREINYVIQSGAKIFLQPK